MRDARYLLPESWHQFQDLLTTHPIPGVLLLAALFGVILIILKKVFGRIAGDVILFGLVIWLITLVFGTSLFTFFHIKGFHFGGW